MPSRHQRFSNSGPRVEPRLGAVEAPRSTPPADGLPHFRAEPRPRQPLRQVRHGQPTHPRWRVWVFLLLLLAACVALVAQHRDWFVRLLPTPQLDHLIDEGNRALAQGHLDAARGYYLQAEAISGENGRAQKGLNAVGMAELARARAALATHRLSDAAQALKQARALLGGGVALQALEHELAVRRARGAERSALLSRAQHALALGRLDGTDGAAGFFQELQRVDPSSAVAQHGLDQVGAALAKQAQASLGSGDLTHARKLIDELENLQPTQAELPALNAELAMQARAKEANIDRMLTRAAQLLAHGHATTPVHHSALSTYRHVLVMEPDDARALAGIARVATALIVQAHAQTDAGDFSSARTLLQQAARLTPQSAELAAARARLARATQKAHRVPVDPAERRQADELVQRARMAIAKEEFLAPPGSCAFDLYRQALALDGESRAAIEGLHALPSEASAAAYRQIGAGHLVHAGTLLQGYALLAPGSQGVDQLQQRLEDAWLARANQDLEQGNRDAAREAVAQAQHLEPNDQRIQALIKGLAGD